MTEEPKNNRDIDSVKSRPKTLSADLWIRFVTILVVAVLLAVLVTYSLTVNYGLGKKSEPPSPLQSLEMLLEELAYYDYDYDEMLDEAIRAYVASSGDPYTVYYNAEEFEQLTKANKGNYVGIGVSAEPGEVIYGDASVKTLRVVQVHKGSPAHKAGILRGDEILAIGTESGWAHVEEVSYVKASAMIRGEAGSEVELSILREMKNEHVVLNFRVKREALHLESVEGRISTADPTVGILSIVSFDMTTPEGLRRNMDMLLESGATRFVIDLRNNGGGDLDSVIACAGMFLQKNDVILSAKNKNGKETVYTAKARALSGEREGCSLLAEDIGKYRDYSFAVLINGDTASAAELLAAVFRDYSLGILVGEKSFGKGSIQGVYSLETYGLEGGIRVTTKMYFPPCGEGYNGIGIEPDIFVAFPEDKTFGTITEAEDPQLTSAIQMLKSK